MIGLYSILRAQGKLRTGEPNLLSMLCCHWFMVRAVVQTEANLQLRILEGEISIHIADLCRHTAAYTIFCVPFYALAHCELWNSSTG